MSRPAATLFAACVTLSATLTAGCADNQETLIVLMAPAWTEGECMVDESSEDPLAFGLLNIDFDTPYLMSAILLNNAPSQATNDNNTGVVSNEIQLKDALVTIDCPQRPDLLDGIDKGALEFKAPLATNSLEPGQTVALAVEVLPLATVRELRRRISEVQPGTDITVRANVTFRGSRTGNDFGKIGRIEARDFSFPIELCTGKCLVECSGCPEDIDITACDFEGTKGVGVSGGVCGNAQDLPLVPNGCEAPG